jgi:catechol 2,3-dioxygenase-like lactoylglutathione lyase family enzyme
MDIQFIAGFGPIVSDVADAAGFYRDDLGLPLGAEGYLASDDIAGSRHFGLWPLNEAAQACFGSDTWPTDRPVPQATVEFEVASPKAVGEAAAELTAKGYALIHDAKEEPWGQTLARLQAPDGLLIGISFTPWMHD